MNYDEMVSRGGGKGNEVIIPIGRFYSTQVDGSYANKLELNPSLAGSSDFMECLRRECDDNAALSSPRQIHFTIDTTIPPGLDVERGRYVTFSQLMVGNPSLTGKKKFVNDTVDLLFEALQALNEKGVYHLCLDPGNVFARKSDGGLMLFSHGSYYAAMPDKRAFYGDMSPYVAPEVLDGGEIGAYSDVYAAGKFIEWLYTMSDMPLEMRRVIKKATADDPADRYQSISDMRSALAKLRAAKKSAITTLVALAVALLIVGIYFFAVPEPVVVEYVKPVEEPVFDDLLDEGFDAETEYGLVARDTTDGITPEQRKSIEEYEKKAEEIFKKRFEKEAEMIISKVYNNEHMGVGEKTFMAESSAMTKELVEAQQQIASEADISDTKSQRLASEIVERITEEKKSQLKRYGIQK